MPTHQTYQSSVFPGPGKIPRASARLPPSNAVPKVPLKESCHRLKNDWVASTPGPCHRNWHWPLLGEHPVLRLQKMKYLREPKGTDFSHQTPLLITTLCGKRSKLVGPGQLQIRIPISVHGLVASSNTGEYVFPECPLGPSKSPPHPTLILLDFDRSDCGF